jgi:small-conductance mechanosensitive channel
MFTTSFSGKFLSLWTIIPWISANPAFIGHQRESGTILNRLNLLLVNDVLNANLMNDVLDVITYILILIVSLLALLPAQAESGAQEDRHLSTGDGLIRAVQAGAAAPGNARSYQSLDETEERTGYLLRSRFVSQS